MGKSLFINGGNATSQAAGTTRYWPVGISGGAPFSNEVFRKIKIREAGVLSKFLIKISDNSATASSTARTRKNEANGSMSVSIAAGATGDFEDTTNTDSIAVDDYLAFQTICGSGGSLTVSIISAIFTPTASNVTYVPLVCINTNAGTLATAGVTRHITVTGELQFAATTENFHQNEARIAGTLHSMCLYMTNNARSTATVMRSRINGADGNLAVSVPGGSTGIFEDLSNSDSIAVDDKFNYSITTGLGTGAVQLEMIKADFETTDDNGIITTNYVFGTAPAAGVTNYVNIGGTLIVNATETYEKLKLREDFTFSLLCARVSANTLSGTLTIRLRKNSANANLVISVAAGTTGWFEDTTNTDSCVGTDEVNYSIVTAAGTGNATVRNISICAVATSLRNLTRTIGESLTFTSDHVRSRLLLQLVSESFTISSDHIRKRGLIQTIAESFAITSDHVKLRGKWRTIAESLGFASTHSRLTTRLRTIVQSFSITSDHVRIRTKLGRVISESLAFSSDHVRKRGLIQTISDSFAIVEQFLQTSGLVKTIAESLAFSSTHSRLTGRIRTINHPLSISSNHVRLTTRLRTITQSLSISSDHNKYRMLVQTVAESLAFTSSHSRLRNKWRTIAESLGLASTHSRLTNRIKTIAQSLGFASTHSRLRGKWRTIAQSLTFSSVHSRMTNRIRTIAHSLAFTSNHIWTQIGTKIQVISESLNFNTDFVVERFKSFFIKILVVKSNK